MGQATREEIHQKGLLHKEIHVWFYTPQDEIIFQHRAAGKDTYPNLLDATVGGHVEQGDSYLETALKEAREEVGIEINPSELVFIETTITTSFDPVTGSTNHPRREVFAHYFTGSLSDLKVEEGESVGFEAWPIDKLFNLSDVERDRFIPSYVSEEGLARFKKVRAAFK